MIDTVIPVAFMFGLVALFVAKRSRLIDDIRGWIWGHETQLARMKDRIDVLEQRLDLREERIAELETRIEQLPRLGPYR